MNTNRRCFIGALFVLGVRIPLLLKRENESIEPYSNSLLSRHIATSTKNILLTPEQFGAKGDGIHHDGIAFKSLIDYINTIDASTTVTIECNGKYNIMGTMVPDSRDENISSIIGIPPITKDNVVIKGNNSTFFVPHTYPFVSKYKDQAQLNSYAICFHIKGNSCVIKDASIIGNIDSRSIARGPSPRGNGGQEFGIIVKGDNVLIDNCLIQGWGTDCVLVNNLTCQIKNSILEKARRNCISVVPRSPQGGRILEILNCTIKLAGYGDSTQYNNPGAGLQVESGKRYGDFESRVNLNDCTFDNNRRADVQLSKNAIDCTLKFNRFTNNCNLRPGQLGGHLFFENSFYRQSRIVSTNIETIKNPIRVIKNKFTIKPFLLQKRSKQSREPKPIQIAQKEGNVLL